MRFFLACVILLLSSVTACAQEGQPQQNRIHPESRYARYQLGLSYAEGGTRPRDDVEAARLMSEALLQATGLFGEPWHTAAVRLCGRDSLYVSRPWTDVGLPTSDTGLLYQQGLAYVRGREIGYGVEKDTEKGMALLRHTSGEGHPLAQAELFGILMSDSTRTAKERDEALGYGHAAMERGHYRMTYALADLYREGEKVALDPAKAVILYKRANEQIEANAACWQKRLDGGDKQAAFQLGLIYSRSVFSPTDLLKADSYFRIAAEAGLAEGQTFYATYIQDPSLWKEARQTDPYARYSVGERCRMAVRWYKEAAAQGRPSALGTLSAIADNKGCHRASDSDIFKGFLRAADEPSRTIEQLKVAEAYEHGRGTRKDLVKAMAWYEICVRSGYPLGEVAIDGWKRLQGQLTEAERRQARAIADAYLAVRPHMRSHRPPFDIDDLAEQ